MEGKALLLKYLGGVDAWPIMLDSKEADVRLAAIYDIELVGSKKSVAQLARMLADEDEAVRTAARGALVKIVGEDLGDDKKPWLEWHHENVKR